MLKLPFSNSTWLLSQLEFPHSRPCNKDLVACSLLGSWRKREFGEWRNETGKGRKQWPEKLKPTKNSWKWYKYMSQSYHSSDEETGIFINQPLSTNQLFVEDCSQQVLFLWYLWSSRMEAEDLMNFWRKPSGKKYSSILKRRIDLPINHIYNTGEISYF